VQRGGDRTGGRHEADLSDAFDAVGRPRLRYLSLGH
jgi:hypothetical protein